MSFDIMWFVVYVFFMPRSVSQVLKDAIRRSGRSIRDISRATEVDSGNLGRFLHGERGLSTQSVDALCHELGLELTAKRIKKKR